MTQEEKQLLLVDLCGRLLYGVIAQVDGWDDEEEIDVIVPLRVYSINTDGYVYFGANEYNVEYCMIEDCTPYLRPIHHPGNTSTIFKQRSIGILFGCCAA